MNVNRPLLGATCAIAGALIFLALYIVAAQIDHSYVFGKNYLSDLGVSSGAWAFNAGVILAGVLEALFAVMGWYPLFEKGVLRRISQMLLVLGCAFLASVGILTERFDPEHLIVSVGFFLTMLSFLGISSLLLWRTQVLGRFGAAVTTGAFVLGLALLPAGFVPSSETIAVLALNGWGIIIASLIIMKNR